jgi:membrane-associated protease RseP (regulator of RpoE activity)
MTFPKVLLHILLFVLTLFTTTVAGVAWLNIDPFDLSNLLHGLPYSLSLLFILTCHEFGHYFAARYHGVDASLPFYIPFPPYLNPFGTMGAVIRTRSYIANRNVLFDIGAYGPIAGFVATMIVLIYGFTHLPPKEFILTIHPEYFNKPSDGAALTFGSSLLYEFFSVILPNSASDFIPPMSEMYHYPFLCAGWFGLFVTALNMIPIGQSDGGHIAYAMFGKRSQAITFAALVFFSIIGTIPLLSEIGIDIQFGSVSWLLWPLIMFALNRGKLSHPEIEDQTPIDRRRMLIGFFTLFIFIVSFMPTPLSEILN